MAPVTGLLNTLSTSQVQGLPARPLGAQYVACSSPASNTSLWLHLSTTEPSISGLVPDPLCRTEAFLGLASPASFHSLALSDNVRNKCSRAYRRLFPAGPTATVCSGSCALHATHSHTHHAHVRTPGHVCIRAHMCAHMQTHAHTQFSMFRVQAQLCQWGFCLAETFQMPCSPSEDTQLLTCTVPVLSSHFYCYALWAVFLLAWKSLALLIGVSLVPITLFLNAQKIY